jgi:hypothetical protein
VPEAVQYLSSAAVEAAIKSKARDKVRTDGSLNVNQLITQAYFDRFLCRVFFDGDESDWVLKGGTGMLARVPNTRATLDIDLYRNGYPLEQAVEDLKRLAAIDLGDYFRFVFVGQERMLTGENQPYANGYRLSFDALLGARKIRTINVDLVAGVGVTAPTITKVPEYRLDLPRLASNDYRIYGIADQVADKVCATMAVYATGPSSRVKDLVDLVVIARTHDINAGELAHAIAAERELRQLDPFTGFQIPAGWAHQYTRLAQTITHCAQERTLDDAATLMRRFLDPVLTGLAAGTWSCTDSAWIDRASAP